MLLPYPAIAVITVLDTVDVDVEVEEEVLTVAAAAVAACAGVEAVTAANGEATDTAEDSTGTGTIRDGWTMSMTGQQVAIITQIDPMEENRYCQTLLPQFGYQFYEVNYFAPGIGVHGESTREAVKWKRGRGRR